MTKSHSTNELLWASDQELVVTDPVNFTSRELIRVQVPRPSVWTIMGRVDNVSALHAGTNVFRVLVGVGVGRMITGFELIFSPLAGPWQIAMLPASFISIRMQAQGTAAGIPPSPTWTFAAWCAPQNPIDEEGY